MTRAWAAIAGISFLCIAAAGQQAKPEFEAVDVHASPAGATPSGGFLPGGRAEFRAVTLLRLIRAAYSLPAERVTGGPNWIDTDRFDVVAQAPSSTPREALPAMLQHLLAERFDLSIQHEEKPLPVFALVMGKRGPPKESATPGDPECQRSNEENTLIYTCRNTTMAALAESLPGVAPAYFTRPVVDRTNLKGAYNFRLEWVGRGQLPAGPEALNNSLSIFSSIEKQLGVRVESQTAPQPVLTVARANRNPTPNAPGVTEKLGDAPTEFEVAEVRPSRPDEKEDFKMENGRIDAKAIKLRDLIQFVWNLEDDTLTGGEKWLDSERFDIVAKSAPTASVDTLRMMLRALLVERFGLKVHEDRQPATVYALAAVKPKLRNADPAERSTCNMSLVDAERVYTCQNATMAQFAERLRAAAAGYMDHPVVDLTGLEGGYDFTLTWAPRNRVYGRGGPPANENGANGPAPASADPSGELTVFEAVDRQLGLRLAVQKHTMPVIVIDHMERKPAEN